MTQPVEEIGPVEAAARIADFEIVDVRAAHEFDGPLGHLPGARWIPLAEIGTRAGELDAKRPKLLVCRSGARSRKACEVLTSLGVARAINLAGGMIAWNESGLPIEQAQPPSRAALLESIVAWVAQVGRREREAVSAELGAGPLEHALERVEDGFRRGDVPPDLELSLAAFRRWLAAL